MEVAAASGWPGSSRRSHLLQFLLHASKVNHLTFPPFSIEIPTKLNLTWNYFPAAARPPAHRQVLRARVLRRALPPRAPEVIARRSPRLNFGFHSWGAGCYFILFDMLARGRKMGFCGARSGRAVRSWLVEPLRDSNLQLFALVAVWIASKVIRYCLHFFS
jgi:hypothetical protein